MTLLAGESIALMDSRYQLSFPIYSLSLFDVYGDGCVVWIRMTSLLDVADFCSKARHLHLA